MNELFKLADNSILVYWLIDRIASGYGYDLISSLYKENFGLELSISEFDEFKLKYNEQISNRYNELKQMIYDSGTFSKLTSVADKLYEMVNNPNDLSPKELASIADTLRKYLDMLVSVGKKTSETKQFTTNNFLLLKSLEDEQLIKILNPTRLQYIVDGVVEDAKVEEAQND
ncbi:MAG: hypothetical protein PWP52_1644 [Bacteroidales bacterium]|nr:hypothetical protein [Bacteroidales bacterium]MDN5355784.1 hypothetical protein [Rikenellaceae bacterium]